MKATIVPSSSRGAQRRLDPAYHVIVQQHKVEIDRLEATLSTEQMVAVAQDLVDTLDPKGRQALSILSRSNEAHVGKDRILRGIQEDPSLGLVLARRAALDMLSRVESERAIQDKLFARTREQLESLDRQSLKPGSQFPVNPRRNSPSP